MATHHVFISYAHIDNVPITEEQQGWISRFHSTLEVFLSQRLGGRARIWRDLKLQGNDVFGDEIVDAFRDTTLFFSILTPRYVRSDWCKREIQEFCHHAEQTDGLVIENKSRVFKVIKTPVDRNTAERLLPPVVRDSLGYEFFVQDAQGPIELDPDFGERYKQDYLRKVCILANNAAQLIQQVEDEKAEKKARAEAEAAAATAAAQPDPTPKAGPAAKPAPPAKPARASKRASGSKAAAQAAGPGAVAPAADDPAAAVSATAAATATATAEGAVTAEGAAAAAASSEPENAGAAAGHAPAAAKRTVVFLASCSFDLRDQRELIEADLRGHGYRVLPEQRLPGDDEAEHRQAVAVQIEQAQLSLHLIGSGYGAVPDGPSHQSLVEIQNTMAAERSASHGLSRLIWLPQDTSSEQPDQVRFLDALRREAAPQRGADLLSGSLEELRTVLHANLDRLENPPPPPPSRAVRADATETSAAAGRMVYLICVAADRKATVPLRKWLKAEGWEVTLPAFEGDAAALRETHEGQLRCCRAALIFYGAGDEAWHRSVAMDLRRAPAYRDGVPLPPPITYLASPCSDDKQDMVDMEEPNLVDGLEGFEPAALQPFLDSINDSNNDPTPSP
ncbi:MAG: DUF4062 domain-containing protein [Synechococcaceae cyanobacterium]|jgi:hypothetical protein